MDTEWPAGVQDLPEGGRGPMLLTQPADLGCMVEPRIFTVVLGHLGQDPAEFWTPARRLAPATRHPDLSAEGTALHNSNYSYYEYSIVMTIITLEAVLASWPRDQTLCRADRHTFASRPLASDAPCLTSVFSSAKRDEAVEGCQFPLAAPRGGAAQGGVLARLVGSELPPQERRPCDAAMGWEGGASLSPPGSLGTINSRPPGLQHLPVGSRPLDWQLWHFNPKVVLTKLGTGYFSKLQRCEWDGLPILGASLVAQL